MDKQGSEGEEFGGGGRRRRGGVEEKDRGGSWKRGRDHGIVVVNVKSALAISRDSGLARNRRGRDAVGGGGSTDIRLDWE